MAVTIGELTTEIIAESDDQLAETGPVTAEKVRDMATIRTDLAAIAQQTMRTRAEGFDD
jgi:hypothetical protein